MRLIDIHTHLGKIMQGKKPLTASTLVKTMDKHGIEKSVVLPIENPEETHWYYTTEQVLKECKKFPDRLIPFCNIDPRRGENKEKMDFQPLIEEYVERGCRGFGEILANLKTNDKRLKKIYKICGMLKFPVLLHLQASKIGIYDPVGLPYLEKVLLEFPQTVFIAHGPGFWAEISANVTAKDKNSYPTGKVIEGGKVDYLLSNYPNLYGDLSAPSGYNAISRDVSYAKNFLFKHQKQLLFGTDYLAVGQELPIIDFLKNLELPLAAKENIFYKNAMKILS